MGQFGPNLHCSGFGTDELGFDCFLSWGSTFTTGGLGIVAVEVVVLLAQGIGQSFLNSKRLPDIFPTSGQGVLTQTGASSKGGGCFLRLEAADYQDLLRP